MSKIPGWSNSSPALPATACGDTVLEDDMEKCTFPAMPTVSSAKANKLLHREKLGPMPIYNAMVARPVTRTEMESSQQGLEAIGKEWGGQ